MPRAVNPRLGDDGYGTAALPRVRLYKRQVDALMRYFEKTPSVSVTQLTRYLSEVGMQHRRGADRGYMAISRAEARAALDYVLKLPVITGEDIMLLNGRAFDAVFNELMMTAVVHGDDDSVFDQIFRDQLDPACLRAACEAARMSFVGKRGPDPDNALYACAADLCHLFEVLAGTHVTLSNKDTYGDYRQIPASDGARFVREALILITGRDNLERGERAKSAANDCIAFYISNRSKRPVQTLRTTAAA